jgi:hypothetical protein
LKIKFFQCQGQTIKHPTRIQADLNESFSAAMCYVILSRIVSLSQLFLFPFDEAKIYCNEKAKEEALKLKSCAINRQTTPWNTEQENTIKIASLNVRSLNQHFEDLQNDYFLQKSDIICLTETWLSDDLENTGKYHSYFINSGSKGIALFSVIQPVTVEKFSSEVASIIIASYQDFDLILAYRFSENSNIHEFAEEVVNILNLSRTVIICGDININLDKFPQNKFSKSLFNLGFIQLVNSPTHILGGIIDHVYFYSSNMSSCSLYKIYPVYYSDHDAISFFLQL